MSRRSTARSLVAGLSALSLIALGLAAAPAAAFASTSILVGSTSDADNSNACSNPTVVTPVTPVTLRSAVCVANNIGGDTTITVPAGTYTITGDALAVGITPGTSITLTSSGGTAVLDGTGSRQLLNLDMGLQGGIDVEITGFEFRGGRDSLYGGGAIIGGNGGYGDADTLTITDSVFTNNYATGAASNFGGAIQFIGGDLTITDSRFQGNSNGYASGGAIYYESLAASDALTVTGSTFTANTVASPDQASGGGALYIAGGTGTATITGNVFTNNSASGTNPYAGAIESTIPSTTAHFNSFTGNTGLASVRATGDFSNNWWGCNGGPGASGCDTATITGGSSTPYLALSLASSAASIDVSGSATVTASLRTNSVGATIAGSNLTAFDGGAVNWSTNGLPGAGLSGASTLSQGQAVSTFTATSGGAATVTAQFGSASVSVPITVTQAPQFTTPVTAQGTKGTQFDFTITAAGQPLPTVDSVVSDIPGVAVTNPAPYNEVKLSGVPTATGVYHVYVTASAGGTPITQDVTVTIVSIPTVPSPLSATVPAGEAHDVTITMPGFPAPVLTFGGPVPAGFTLTNGSAGTAQLHVPANADPGWYTLPLLSTNSAGTNFSTFALTVTTPPRFLDDVTLTVPAATGGASGVIPVDPGFPALNTVTLVDAPAWVSLSGAPGSQVLVVAPMPGVSGVQHVTLGIQGSTVTTEATITVLEAPFVTQQPASTQALAGTTTTFTSQASGYPVPTVQWQRQIGGGWQDIAGATTGTLALPVTLADEGATVRAVFTSTSGTAYSSSASVAVGEEPEFNGVPGAVSGDAGLVFNLPISFTGVPLAPVTATSLPSWLTLTNTGPGTATLSGIPSIANVGTTTVTLGVDNGFGTDSVTIQITIVGAVPAVSGPLTATIAESGSLDLVVNGVGYPLPVLGASTLPAGVTFVPGAPGTGRLEGGSPLAPGQYTFTLTATNLHGTVPATFTLMVTAPPEITSADHTTFTANTTGQFTVMIDPGYPVLNTLVVTGAPAWLQRIDDTLYGIPPTGSGGTYPLELSIAGSDVVQQFTLTVQEAPYLTGQPADATVLEGTDAVFTASAAGYPAPTVQWQSFTGGTWNDIAGATADTLTLPTTIDDDGTRLRAVFTNTTGTALSDEVQLTVGQEPGFEEIDPVTALAGGPVTVDVTTTGLPTGEISASGLPAWLSFTDNGDGTATLSGTPALTDAGTSEITVTVDNGFGTADARIEITVNTEVPLPLLLGTADGPLTGVPSTVQRGQQITISGGGFLPGAVVALGIYSTPTALGTAVADGTGSFTATVTIPADHSFGAHTVAASGIGAEGTARLLIGSTTVVDPTTGGGSTGALPATGLNASQTLGMGLIALLAVLGGLVLVRAARRRLS